MRVGEKQPIEMNAVETLKEIERQLARFSLKVHVQHVAYRLRRRRNPLVLQMSALFDGREAWSVVVGVERRLK